MASVLLTPELIEHIKGLCALGIQWQVIADAVGVEVSTLKKWRFRGRDEVVSNPNSLYAQLWNGCREARAQSVIRNVEIIQQDAESNRDPNVASMALDTTRALAEAIHRSKVAKIELQEAKARALSGKLDRNRKRLENARLRVEIERIKAETEALKKKPDLDYAAFRSLVLSINPGPSSAPTDHSEPMEQPDGPTETVDPVGSLRPTQKPRESS